MSNRDIEFLFEVGSLRNLERSWKQVVGMPCASVLEHTLRVMCIALLLARMEGEKNEEKVMKMALVHDFTEARTGDANAVHAVYVTRHDKRAANDLFVGTLLEDLHASELAEYEERKTLASKIVKDADNLEVDLELKEFEERGSRLPRKWLATRKLIRNKKLYTKSARRLWDEIQKADPNSWFCSSMKWKKLKNAGK